MTYIPPGFVPFKVWKEKENDDVELRNKLAMGKLQAFYIDNGKMTAVETSEWISVRGEAMLYMNCWSKRFYSNNEPSKDTEYTAEFTAYADDKRVLVIKENEEAEPAKTSVAKRGGRPPKYNWIKIFAELLRIVHEDGFPATQVAMREKLQLWYAKQPGSQGQEIGDTVLKELVSACYEACKRGPET